MPENQCCDMENARASILEGAENGYEKQLKVAYPQEGETAGKLVWYTK